MTFEPFLITPNIVQTTPQLRQLSKAVEFPPDLARYIDWASIGEAANQMAANFETKRLPTGAILITFFWNITSCPECEAEDLRTASDGGVQCGKCGHLVAAPPAPGTWSQR